MDKLLQSYDESETLNCFGLIPNIKGRYARSLRSKPLNVRWWMSTMSTPSIWRLRFPQRRVRALPRPHPVASRSQERSVWKEIKSLDLSEMAQSDPGVCQEGSVSMVRHGWCQHHQRGTGTSRKRAPKQIVPHLVISDQWLRVQILAASLNAQMAAIPHAASQCDTPSPWAGTLTDEHSVWDAKRQDGDERAPWGRSLQPGREGTSG
jgi:hypothetical protein